MASLKFQNVIDFYRANNDAVYKDLKTAYLGGRLTPFVGAGLSVFCGYKLWPNVLKELSEFIPDEGPKQKALEMIDQFKYLEAAEHIQAHYHPMLRRLQGIVSYDKLEACPPERLYSSAAWVLPYLFHNRPLMTTNFDGVLEYVFSKQGSTFERVVEPHDPSLLTQLRQQDIHGLFKLHGDIGRETASLDRLVFTKSQYDDAYCEDDKLMKELKQWYQNQTLLFLGCSLAMDKTMEVLRDVASDNPGIRHFAIVGCKKAQRSELLDRFSELGIDAIFYDDSNHDAVRVILENLLYETDPDAYQQLDDEMRRFVGPVKRDDVLMYNAGRIKYVGRTDELSALERFCSSPVNNEWWAVTGPGGMGKSRLIYEFTNKKQKEGWQVLWFSREQYHRLTDLQLPAENTIVVLDDVQADTQTAGEWLQAMRTHRRANRLRILLIEREGADYGSADWLRVLRSGNPYSDPLTQWCHNKAFLHLKPLTDGDLKAIMESCAEALGKSIDSDALLTALGRVDGELRRPLYALAIAEAACGGEDPLHWNPERVLDEMLDRELAFHYESLRYVLKQDPTLTQQQELELLMAQCCIYGHLSVDAVTKETYPHLTDCMAGRSSAEFFRCLGLLHAEEGKSVLRMNCPDLIKEHLVLRLAFEQNTLELLPDGWQLERDRLRFLYRLWSDCPDRLADKTAFWDRFFSALPASGLPAWDYADLLWDCTAVFPPLAQRAVDTLDIWYRADSKDERIAACYANSLFNLSNSQPPKDRAATMEQLRELYVAHSENAEVAVPYAMGLVNLSCVQSPEDRADTVERLKYLYDAHSETAEVAVQYAKGLVNLSCDQSPEDRVGTVERLKDLYDVLSENAEVTGLYATGLFNLSCVQSPEDRADTVEMLRELHGAHSENTEVVVEYAKGLVNLSYDQPPEDRADTVERLKDLYDTHSENAEVTVQYAKGLVYLSCDQSPEDRVGTVERLKDLYDALSENAEVIGLYAMGLYNLSISQSSKDRAATVDQLEALYNRYPAVQEIAQHYAGSLVNLAFSQTKEADVRRTLARSRAILDQHSDDSEIQLYHAQTWFNLTLVQSESDIPATVSDIAVFLRTHPDAIPAFREALDEHLSEHPDHAARYRPLLELGGDGHA